MLINECKPLPYPLAVLIEILTITPSPFLAVVGSNQPSPSGPKER